MYNLPMLVICPQCHAENEDVARFCNQCGSPLGNTLPENKPAPAAAPPVPEASKPDHSANWSGLVIIAIIILAIWWIVGSKPSQTEEGGAAPMMEQVIAQVAGLKEKLASDPGDVDTVQEMYQLYAQVGKTEEVTPYTIAALEHIEKNADNMDSTLVGDKLLALFISAYEAHDDAVCIDILKVYQKQFPDNIRILKVLGDLSYDQAQWEQALDYYGQYLEQADREEDPENYKNAMTDRGSCYIQLAGEDDPDPEQLANALETFEQVLAMDPEFWQAHFNKGVVLQKLGQLDEAEQEWRWCIENTDSSMEAWRAEFAISEMRGTDPPAMPSSPHGEGGMMTNPHGEGGMMNPHGEDGMGMSEGTAPPLDGNNLPPNPHSQEFLEENSRTP